MSLSRFWLVENSKNKKSCKNVKVDDETIMQIKNLIKIYRIVYGFVKNTDEDFGHSAACLDELKYALKQIEQNKKINKNIDSTKTEFDNWVNSREWE